MDEFNKTLDLEGLTYYDTKIKEVIEEKAPLASPELTGTPKAPTASTGTNTTQIATTAFVQTAVSEGIAASDALIFKGTLGTTGTITVLPTTYKTGWTYRVVTDGTYAGQECEIGDLVIALVDRKDVDNADSDWCVAQTNIDGAITGIKSGDAYIEISQSGSVVTIKHKDVTRTNTTSTAKPSHGGTFTAVKSVTSDAKGHVTGVDTETVTLPTYKAGDNITFTLNADNDEITIKSSHETITTSTDTTSTESPSAGDTFTTVDSVTRDSNGHVTKVNTKTVTLPSTAVTVDSALSDTSENPIQNKVVKEALDEKITSGTSLFDEYLYKSSVQDIYIKSYQSPFNITNTVDTAHKLGDVVKSHDNVLAGITSNLNTLPFDDSTSTYSTLSAANSAAETTINNIKNKVSLIDFIKNAKQSFSAIIQGLKILGTNVGAIQGITGSLTATSSNVALSAKGGNNLQGQINTLNSSLTNVSNNLNGMSPSNSTLLGSLGTGDASLSIDPSQYKFVYFIFNGRYSTDIFSVSSINRIYGVRRVYTVASGYSFSIGPYISSDNKLSVGLEITGYTSGGVSVYAIK